MRRIVIPRELLKRIIDHAREEFPKEACGLLAGWKEKNGDIVVKEAYRTKNIADSPHRYEMEPRSMYEAFLDADSKGIDILGAYHSHPYGEPEPSAYDEERAHPGFIYLIVGLECGEKVRAFIWDGKNFEEMEVFIT